MIDKKLGDKPVHFEISIGESASTLSTSLFETKDTAVLPVLTSDAIDVFVKSLV